MRKKLKQLIAFLRRGKLAPPKPEYKSGETWDWAKWGCPGCGGTEIYEGPSGGACQNICCANQACQRAFNLGPCGWTEDIPNTVFLSAFEPEPEKFGKWKEASDGI